MSGDSDATTPPGASPFRFDVTPYQSDGGYSLPGLLFCFALVFAFAVGLGYLAHFPDTWLPGVEWVLALGLGLAMAGLGCLAVGWTRIRSIGMAGLVGFLGGVLALGATHYWNYRAYLDTLDTEVKKYVIGQVAFEMIPKLPQKGQVRAVNAHLVDALRDKHIIPNRITEEVKPVIHKLAKDGKIPPPVLLEALFMKKGQPPPDLGPEVDQAVAAAVAGFGFWDYLDWKARRGAALALPKVRKDLTLGYTGSYILWGVEAFLAGCIAAGIMAFRSQKPFCAACGVWKEEREMGRLNLNSARAIEVFSSGALAELAGEDLARKDGSLRVSVRVCGRCGEENPIDVKLIQITKNSKGKEETSELAHLTYPGPALRVLEALFAPGEEAALDPKAVPSADQPHD
jgi:hypothetical protein